MKTVSARIPNRKTTYALVCAALFFVVRVSAANAATITWDGSDSTSWSLGANWVGNVAPIASDDVVISGSYTNAPTLDLTGGVTINSLSNGNTTSNKLTVTGDVTIGSSPASPTSSPRP